MKQNLFQTGAVMALAFLLVMVTAAQPARAAAEGKPLPSDFVCHTVGIGDDDGKVIAAFGAPEALVKKGVLDRVFSVRCRSVVVDGIKEYIIRPGGA